MAYTGEQKREYQRKWIAARRAEYLSDKSCVECGSAENLEVDHINPNEKEVPIGQIWSLAKDNPRRFEELEKCQILCYDHHKEKTIREANSRAKHGRTLYEKGCVDARFVKKQSASITLNEMPHKH